MPITVSPEQVAALTPPKCDIFAGDWVPDQSGPVYTNKSCPEIEAHQNCMRNGRPDTGYFYWRWRPRDCDLRRFDPNIFLNMMRDKSWAFIGDSISRNHVQSLLCILSQVHHLLPISVSRAHLYLPPIWFCSTFWWFIAIVMGLRTQACGLMWWALDVWGVYCFINISHVFSDTFNYTLVSFLVGENAF